MVVYINMTRLLLLVNEQYQNIQRIIAIFGKSSLKHSKCFESSKQLFKTFWVLQRRFAKNGNVPLPVCPVCTLPEALDRHQKSTVCQMPIKFTSSFFFYLQFNDNQLDSWEDLDQFKSCTKLQTIYLERNPIWQDTAYRRKVKLALPAVTQIDATLCA